MSQIARPNFKKLAAGPIIWHISNTSCLYDAYKQSLAMSNVGIEENQLVQCHIFTRCRDIVGTYLQGALLRNRNYEHGQIGWCDGRTYPYWNKLLLFLKVTKSEKKDMVTDWNLRKLIHPIERQFDLPLSRVFPVEYKISGFHTGLLVADKFWMLAPPLFSFYMQMLRCTPHIQEVRETPWDTLENYIRLPLDGRLSYQHRVDTARLIVSYQVRIKQVLDLGPQAWKKTQKEYYEGPEFSKRGLANGALPAG